MDTCVDACCPNASDSLIEAALKILRAADPWKKAEYTYAAVDLWRSGQIKQVASDHCSHLNAPERPARADDKVRPSGELLSPSYRSKLLLVCCHCCMQRHVQNVACLLAPRPQERFRRLRCAL